MSRPRLALILLVALILTAGIPIETARLGVSAVHGACSVSGDSLICDGANDIVTNTLTVTGSINLGGGSDSLLNSTNGVIGDGGTGDGIFGASGNDTIINRGVVNSGSVTAIDGGTGNDSIVNRGTITGIINGSDNDDTLVNSLTGRITSSNSNPLDGGAGNDLIINLGLASAASSTSFGIYGNFGDDTLDNRASGTLIGELDGGDGHDSILNAGSVSDQIQGGDGDDTVSNSGTVGAGVNLGEGLNSLNNSGVIAGNVIGGSINGIVNLGTGNDVIDNASTINQWTRDARPRDYRVRLLRAIGFTCNNKFAPPFVINAKS